MLFVQLLNALDEILYEMVSWIVLYPITLWKIVSRPITMMCYAREELRRDTHRQYLAAVSPPIMLILTEVLSQAISLAVTGADPILSNRHGLASIINDNATLFVARLFLFAVCAITLAAREVHAGAQAIDRDNLKAPFYVQCYAIAPVAVVLGAGTIAAGYDTLVVKVVGSIAAIGALVFYFVVEVRWFRLERGRSIGRAIADATIGLVASFLILLAAGWLLER